MRSRLSAASARIRPVLAGVLLAGCHGWHAHPLPTPGVQALGGRTRATLADGRQLDLAKARIDRDTLHAERYRIGRDGRPTVLAVPMDSVRALETRRVSWSRTLGLVAGIWLGVGALGALLVGGG